MIWDVRECNEAVKKTESDIRLSGLDFDFTVGYLGNLGKLFNHSNLKFFNIQYRKNSLSLMVCCED